MSLPPLGALVDLIIRLRLAPPEALRSVQALIASQSSEEFVDLLEKQQVLTGFQIERLRTGDTDGLVLGDCKLMYRVASGSFARFYRGANVVTGQQLGIKVLRDRWANDPDFVSLFRREGEIGKRLIHPNIVPIYEVGSSGKYHFLVMEFVEGGNLRDFLKIRKKFSIIETLKFAVDVLKGLDFALRQGITHRDLKMTNVLMSSSGVAKLIDFGLAADDSMISKANGSALQNALEYSTLEKHTGAPRNDPRSDLYFLGGILFELLTGQPPYARTRDRDERKSFHRYRDVPPIETVDPSLPRPIRSIVNKLMAIDPIQRYQTPTEVLGDVQRAIQTSNSQTTREESGKPTVLCLESRPKHQDFFRDYLTSRGFHVAIVSDPQRALKRIAENPPECLLVLGDAFGDEVAEFFTQAIRTGRDSKLAGVVVLAESQKDLASQISVPPGRARILIQPVNLREVRQEIETAIEARNKSQ
ncbi:MAG: serine/threonine protein kinase [Planctomycetota bacterium]|jgi:serine/threonine protein kinase|nr:MAG: serine/threonine protein kinase [Planctomycetota bacterium]